MCVGISLVQEKQPEKGNREETEMVGEGPLELISHREMKYW